MNDRLAVILSSADPAVARTGAMYALNALKHGWMADVRLFVFGPSQQLVLEDEELQRLLAEYRVAEEEPAVACRFLAERDETAVPTRELGLHVEYVGPLISELIREGYVPMVW